MEEILKWKIRQNLRARVTKGRPPSLILEIAKVISEDEIVRLTSKKDRLTEELNYIRELTPAILEEDFEERPPEYLPEEDRKVKR